MMRLAVISALAFVAIGCEPNPSPTTSPSRPPSGTSRVTSSDGLALRDWVAKPAVEDAERTTPCPRIISAAPNLTEICCALGLADCLVGRTRYCTYPPAVADVPSIGALNEINAEVLVGLAPELILVAGASRNITDRLQLLGLRFETLPDTSLADLFTSIKQLGPLVNRPQTAAQLAENVRADLQRVAERYEDVPRARVLLVIGPLASPPAPPFAAGPGSFYDDLLQRAGHDNIAAAAARPFAPLTLEFIAETDPDVIIELARADTMRTGGDDEAVAAWDGIAGLTAVAERRVHVLRGAQHGILGPRIAQTFEALCTTIAGRAHE